MKEIKNIKNRKNVRIISKGLVLPFVSSSHFPNIVFLAVWFMRDYGKVKPDSCWPQMQLSQLDKTSQHIAPINLLWNKPLVVLPRKSLLLHSQWQSYKIRIETQKTFNPAILVGGELENSRRSPHWCMEQLVV